MASAGCLLRARRAWTVKTGPPPVTKRVHRPSVAASGPHVQHRPPLGAFHPEGLPQQSGYLAYSTAIDQPMRGVPIREGGLWLLSAMEELALVELSLYVNGFSFTHQGREHSFSLSPFSLVRNCKFQATTADGVDLSDFKCFKVSLFTQNVCFYFGIRASQESDGETERITHSLRPVPLFDSFRPDAAHVPLASLWPTCPCFTKSARCRPILTKFGPTWANLG